MAGWKGIENCLHAGLRFKIVVKYLQRVLPVVLFFGCGVFNLSQSLRGKGTARSRAIIFKCFTCERYHMPCCRRQPDFGALDALHCVASSMFLETSCRATVGPYLTVAM